jgi:predicted house-cleaning noncanonical NTP pyrophosphatase (MazG superfamily)
MKELKIFRRKQMSKNINKLFRDSIVEAILENNKYSGDYKIIYSGKIFKIDRQKVKECLKLYKDFYDSKVLGMVAKSFNI